MANKRVHQCQNCGASLGIPDTHGRFFTCKYCGSVHEDASTDSERAVGNVHISITAQPPIDAGRIPTYGKPRAGSGATVFLVIILVVTGGIAAAVFAIVGGTDPQGQVETGGGKLTFYSYAIAVPVSSDNQTGADAVAIARTSGDEPLVVYFDFDADRPIRWSESKAFESETLTQFAFTENLVIINDEDAVFALNRKSGAEAWTVQLSDKIESTICTDCLRVMGDRVITLTADGTLAAHSVGSGETLWSQSLVETPRQIVNLGGDPAVLDETGSGVKLRAFSRDNGSPVGDIAYTCEGGFPSIYEPLFPAPGGTVAYLSGDGCARRIAAAGRSGSWLVPYVYSGFPRPEPERVHIGETHILVGVEGAVETINLANGEVKQVAGLEGLANRDLYPIGISKDPANVAILAAKSTRGTASWSLIAVDLAAGNVKWEFPLETSTSMTIDLSFAIDDGWTAAITSGGVSVAQRLEDSDHLLVQTIAVGSGTAKPATAIELPNKSVGTNWVSHYGWSGNRLLMAVDGTLMVINGPKAEVIAQGP